MVGDGTELALTLLRATGYLSRAELAFRPNPAGPLDPLEGPQLQRRLALEYAVLPHRGDWRSARLADAADEFLAAARARARRRRARRARARPPGSALAVDGAQVSAVLREPDGDALVIRIFNPSPEPATARVEVDGSPAHGQVVDLAGRDVAPFAESVPLRPWEIVTLRLRLTPMWRPRPVRPSMRS